MDKLRAGRIFELIIERRLPIRWMAMTRADAIVRKLKSRALEATYCEVDSTYGHDAFLLEVAEETHLIKHFLNKTFNSKR